MQGFIVFDFASRYAEAQAALAAMVHDGTLRHQEHLVHGLEHAPEALNMLFTGATTARRSWSWMRPSSSADGPSLSEARTSAYEGAMVAAAVAREAAEPLPGAAPEEWSIWEWGCRAGHVRARTSERQPGRKRRSSGRQQLKSPTEQTPAHRGRASRRWR
jgi:hypothetical protein